MKKILKNLLLIKIITVLLIGFYFTNIQEIDAAINKQINYQGRLLDDLGDPVADTTYSIEFNLYTTATSGVAVWTETQPSVETSNGLFSVMLGSVTSLDSVNFNQTLYLGVDVEADGEMSPRKTLGAVPAAFEADKLDGVSSEQFFRNDQVNSTSTASTFLSLVQNGAGKLMELFDSGMNSLFTVLSNGNIGMGTSTPEYDLQLHKTSGQTDFAITTNVNVGSANTTQLSFISDTDGTPNYASLGQFNDGALRLSGSGNLVTPDITITDSGNVGIGTTSPSQKLSVSGSALISGSVTSSSFTATSTTATSTLPNLSSTNVSVSGRLYDGSASSGTNGYVLQTTGSGIEWVATSSLGLLSDYGIGDSVTSGTAGSVLFVDSSGNLAQDNANFFWDDSNNRLGIGTTSPSTAFSVGNTNGVNITDDGRYFAYTPSNIYTPVFKIEDNRGDVFSYTGGQNYVELNVKTGVSDSNASWVGNFGKGDGIGTLNLNFNAGATTVGRIGIDAGNDFVLAGGDSRDFNFSVGNSANFNITTGASSNVSAVAGNVSGSGNLSLLGTSGTTNNTAGIITTAGDSLALTTASTTRVTITSAGNVGIGTTSPTYKLAVDGDVNITGALRDNGNAGTSGYVLQTTGSGIEWVATSSLGLLSDYGIGDSVTSGTAGSVLFVDSSGNLAQDNANFFWDDSNNRLGIGTTTPDFTLDVSNQKIGIDGTQILFLPDQTDFLGTLIVGNGGGSLSHTSGTEGQENTYVGINAGFYNTTGLRNTAVGKNALWQNTTGFQNSSFGGSALDANTTGTNNSAFGYASLTNSTSSSNNSAFGNYSLNQITSGYANVGFGYLAGAYIADGSTPFQTGNTSVYIGYGTRASANGVSNENVFGYGATGVGSNSVVLGNDSVTKTVLKGDVGIGTTSPSQKLSVSGSALISGSVTSSSFTATSTTATSTLPNLSSTNVSVSGRLYDGSASSGTNGYILQTTGSGISWVATSSLGFATTSPGGTNTQVQFNDNGVFAGDSGFTYNSGTDELTVGSVLSVSGDNSASLTATGLSIADDATPSSVTLDSDILSFNSGSNYTKLSLGYLNFDTTVGSSGFGIRNNAGTVEFKNSSGSWSAFASQDELGLSTTTVAFSAHRNNSNQTVTSSTNTLIDWTTEVFDTNSNFDLTNDRFTPTVAGYYQVDLKIGCTAAATSCFAIIYKNGSVYATGGFGSITYGIPSVSTVIYLNGSSDYIEGYAYVGGQTTLDGITQYTNFSGHLIGSQGGGFDEAGNYTLTGEWDFTNAVVSGLGGQGGDKRAVLVDSKSSGTAGGSATTGSWQTRDLNTEKYDNIGVSISSNQFSLPAGTYQIQASAPAYFVNRHQIRLYNVTDSTVTDYGDSAYSAPTNNAYADVTRSSLNTIFTLTATSTTFRIEHRVGQTQATNGYGVPVGGSFTTSEEIYTVVDIIKIGSGDGVFTASSTDAYFTGGNIGIGTNTPQTTLHVSRSDDGAPVRFQDSNGYCEINPTSTTWTCTSDERLKENILDVASTTPDLYERMMKLRPVTFEWKTDKTNTQRVGFIAQEVEVLFPEFVNTDEQTGLKSVSYGSFITYIISFVQDLSKKVDILAQKIDELTEGGLNSVAGVITKLTVGSKETPTGITMFDEATGDPYCLSIKNGNVLTKIGECTQGPQDNENSNQPPVVKIENKTPTENNEPQENVIIPSNNSGGGVVIENIEESSEQDITLSDEDNSETNNDTVLIVEENTDSVIVETNQSSGSVEIPIE